MPTQNWKYQDCPTEMDFPVEPKLWKSLNKEMKDPDQSTPDHVIFIAKVVDKWIGCFHLDEQFRKVKFLRAGTYENGELIRLKSLPMTRLGKHLSGSVINTYLLVNVVDVLDDGKDKFFFLLEKN